MKTCSTCKTELSLDMFHKNRSRKDGLHGDCKACVSACNRRWRESNPERKQVQNKTVNARRYYRRYTLSQYGLTEDGYAQMHALQEGACAICREAQEVLCVDHDHTTSKVRGLLCSRCNQGLGLFRDNRDFLAQAITYLGE